MNCTYVQPHWKIRAHLTNEYIEDERRIEKAIEVGLLS